MKSWTKRIRAALGLGLTWAVAWAPVGLLIGLVWGGNGVTPDEFPIDDWVMPLAALGFTGGAVFSGILRLAGRSRRFDELSLPRFGVWGALGGIVLGTLAVAGWQLDPGFGAIVWPRAAILVGSTTLLSSLSAAGTLALARAAKDAIEPGSAADALLPDEAGAPRELVEPLVNRSSHSESNNPAERE